jgi:pimeloyl-ACP methyl ester carboxylesterase
VYKIFNIVFGGMDLAISSKIRQAGNELILFIHGLGCTKESFEEVWYSSALNNFSIVTFDLVGYGESSKPVDFSYAMEEQAEICKELLSHFHYERLHIVAHSMGGVIGLLLAGSVTDKLLSFVNIEGNLISADCGMSRRVASVSYAEFEQRLFNGLKKMADASSNRGERLWAIWYAKSHPLGFYRSARSLVEWSDRGDLLRSFLRLGCERVYFYGEVNSHLEVLTVLEGVGKICISKSGHFPMIDNPQEFYSRIAEVIGGIGGAH